MTLPTLRPAALILACTSELLLVGCTAPAPAADSQKPADSDTSENAAEAEGGCPVIDGYELFSSELVTAAPEPGAVYGDGSKLSWTLAVGDGYFPSVYFAYVDDSGKGIEMGGDNLYGEGDGVYANDLNVFDSDADGRQGFASVILVNDGTFTPPAGQEGFDESTIGVYCVTFAVSE